MSFDLNGWNTIVSGGRRGPGGGISVYGYKSPDTFTTIRGNNYFDSIFNRLSIGDSIEIHSTTDNFSEVYLVTQSTPSVVLGQKYPGSKFQDTFNVLLTDISVTGQRGFYPTTLGRKINRITAIINHGTTSVGATLITVFTGDFPGQPVVTDIPLSLGSGLGAGSSVSGVATDKNTMSAGVLSKVEVQSDGGTGAAVEVNVVIETELLIDSI